MAEFKSINSPDIEELNNFVYNNLNASIFQTGHMIEVYNRTKYRKPLSMAIIDKNKDIIASLVAINLSEKKGVLKTFSTHTTIRGGPIVEDSNKGREVCNYLLKEYEKSMMNALYTRVYPLKPNNSISKALEINKYEYEGYLNFIINLNRNKEEIWSDIHKGRRKNINRAKKRFNLVAEELKNRIEIPLFYKIIEETHRHAAISLPDISLFYSAYDLLVPKKLARFIFAKKDDKEIACRLILTHKNEIYDWYAGAFRDSLSYYPNDFLVWHVLSWGSENGFHMFDFGGAGKPNEEYPVRTFKERFGGKLINYGIYTKVHSPLKLKVALKGYETIRKIKKRKQIKKKD